MIMTYIQLIDTDSCDLNIILNLGDLYKLHEIIFLNNYLLRYVFFLKYNKIRTNFYIL